MHHHEAIALLRAWEERFPVLSWRVNDLPVWPLLRLQLGSYLLAAGRPRRPDTGGGPLRRAWRLLAMTGARLRYRSSEVSTIAPVDAVFLGRPANRLPVGGVWRERFFDPIADILEARGLSSQHLEHRQSGTDYHLPRRRPSLVVTGAVARRMRWAGLQTGGVETLDGFEDFASAVCAILPASPTSRRWVAARARAVELLARYFETLLERAHPRIVFCTVYYAPVGLAMCLAARRKGIPSVDVQHGVTRGNPAYEGWTSFPEGGFPMLPAWFWSWSEEDAGPVRAWPESARPAHRAIIGGHPQMALWGSGDPVAESLRIRIPARAGAQFIILVTLTWSSGFSALLRQLLLESPVDWQWWLRLHPLMDRERATIRAWCASHLPERSHVDQPTDLPLPLLLGAADVHLTHNSTVVQEATRAGTPSVVIDRRAPDVYVDELRSGWAVFAAEPAAILRAIPSQHGRRGTLPAPAPYPSWAEMAQVVHDLITNREPCPATAAAASCPTPVQA